MSFVFPSFAMVSTTFEELTKRKTNSIVVTGTMVHFIKIRPSKKASMIQSDMEYITTSTSDKTVISHCA